MDACVVLGHLPGGGRAQSAKAAAVEADDGARMHHAM